MLIFIQRASQVIMATSIRYESGKIVHMFLWIVNTSFENQLSATTASSSSCNSVIRLRPISISP